MHRLNEARTRVAVWVVSRLAAVLAFYGLNGRRLTVTNDQAYDLVMSVASGELDTVDGIAAVLRPATWPRA